MSLSTCIVAIDAATGPCSVAVWAEGRVTAYHEERSLSVPSARLLPMIEQALADSRIGYHDLTGIACTVGPGSFTGIRVGLATARGLCLATGLPGLGFTTLEVLAHAAGAQENKPVRAVLNAGKGEYYYQDFAENPLSQPMLGLLPNVITPLPFPKADALAEIAALRPHSALPLSPFYIRPPDAKPMANNG